MSSPTPCYRGALELSFEEFRGVATDGRKSPSFVVPVDLISRLSPNLGALVKKDRDSTDDVLKLEAVDADTFWRFFQFVFSGSYDCIGHIERDGVEVVNDPASQSLLETPQKRNGTGGGSMFGAPLSPLVGTGGGGTFGTSPSPLAGTGGGLFGTCGMSGPASNSMFRVTKNRDTTMANGSCWSLGSGSPFGAAQSLLKSRSPYSIISKTMTLDTYSGLKVRCKRKRATSDNGEDLGKHSKT
ncbi:hypothetical protein VCV18_012750 [Metarhizium anisopliae]